MPKISVALALAAILAAPFMAAQAHAEVLICSPVRLDCGNGRLDADPPLLLTPNIDINSTVLSVLMFGAGVHPAVSTVFTEPNPTFRRAIFLSEVRRQNHEMLLLHGKRRLPSCLNCGVFNIFDRLHR